MCTVCGCDDDVTVSIDGKSAHRHHHGRAHDHHHHDHHHHDHDHVHDHDHHHHDHDHDAAPVARGDDVHWGEGPARAHVPGLSQARMIAIETNILAKNDGYAAKNRARFAASGTLALNLVSSPGSGKTTLLCATIRALADAFPICVVEGDQQTSNDAERIRATGVRAVQVNTGKGCHLDAHMVGHALERLAPEPFGVVFIENVGNLVCPAAFDLGESAKVAILSVTEGEDKPLKYPDMFAASRLVVLNKTDLAPHCDVDLDLIEENVRRVSPLSEIIRLSARTGEGLDAFTGWIARERRAVLDRAADEAQARADAIRRAAAAE